MPENALHPKSIISHLYSVGTLSLFTLSLPLKGGNVKHALNQQRSSCGYMVSAAFCVLKCGHLFTYRADQNAANFFYFASQTQPILMFTSLDVSAYVWSSPITHIKTIGAVFTFVSSNFRISAKVPIRVYQKQKQNQIVVHVMNQAYLNDYIKIRSQCLHQFLVEFKLTSVN